MDIEDTRLLQPVNIGMTSTEKGKERFKKPLVLSLPETHHWRNNLTALSQRYNLYFVATGAHIAVYVPSFPFQKLGPRPTLTIPPTLANSAADGFIGPEKPHVLDHLIVGDLGEAEIILACTDSGNVAAYHTKSILEAVRTRSLNPNETESTNYIGVRAFFSQWVFESAWGLAIHKHARMIAVSANTPYHEPSIDPCAKITVFAFALSPKTPLEGVEDEGNAFGDDDDTGWHVWHPDVSKLARPDRRLNYKIILAGSEGHHYNIPNVSFVQSVNVQDDQWLLSTDINGAMKLWQIWPGHCHKTWDFSDQQTGSFIPWRERRRQSGWNVAALDPMAFRTTSSVEEFCGWHKAPQYHGHRGSGGSYDITNIVRLRIPGTSQFHPALRGAIQNDAPQVNEDPEDFTDQIFEVIQETEEPDVSQDDRLTARVDSGANPGDSLLDGVVDNVQADSEDQSPETYQQVISGRGVTASSPDPDDIPMQLDSDVEAEAADHAESDQQSPGPRNESEEESESAESTSASSQVDSDVEDYNSEDALLQERIISDASAMVSQNRGNIPARLSQTHSWARALRKAYQRGSKHDDVDSSRDPPRIPMIHCSTSHVRLLTDPFVETPHVFCAQILKQHLPPVIEGTHHAHLDRLNLMQTIPELGVVIIGTQIGRCAVCTLTRKENEGDLGLRVDWILPTKEQERAGLRPLQDLLGIAVGPIQGRMVRNKADQVHYSDEGMVIRSSDGVPTSFDPNVVVLAGPADVPNHESSASDNVVNPEGHSSHSSSPKSKRKRSYSQTSTDFVSESISKLKIEQRPWRTPETLQPWAGTENSRRYRLMMTYTDQTVLTYELSREHSETEMGTVEDGGRKNLRNRPLF